MVRVGGWKGLVCIEGGNERVRRATRNRGLPNGAEGQANTPSRRLPKYRVTLPVKGDISCMLPLVSHRWTCLALGATTTYIDLKKNDKNVDDSRKKMKINN